MTKPDGYFLKRTVETFKAKGFMQATLFKDPANTNQYGPIGLERVPFYLSLLASLPPAQGVTDEEVEAGLLAWYGGPAITGPYPPQAMRRVLEQFLAKREGK